MKTNWLLGLNGMKLDVLDGRTSFANRAFASDRTMKISASIATTFWIKQPNSDADTVDLFRRKTVIGSTTFARRDTQRALRSYGADQCRGLTPPVRIRRERLPLLPLDLKTKMEIQKMKVSASMRVFQDV